MSCNLSAVELKFSKDLNPPPWPAACTFARDCHDVTLRFMKEQSASACRSSCHGLNFELRLYWRARHAWPQLPSKVEEVEELRNSQDLDLCKSVQVIL